MSRHSTFFKGPAPGNLAVLLCVYGQHKVDLVGGFVGLFGCMWGRAVKGWEDGPGPGKNLKSKCDWGTGYSIFFLSQAQQNVPGIPMLGAETGRFMGVAGQSF